MQASCLCGQLTANLSASAEPIGVACHCHDCQRRTGAPFGTLAYVPQGEVTLKGEAREYVRTTDAGNTFTQGFCPRCGSTLYAYPSKYPGMIGISIGCFADSAFAMPVRSVYERSKHGWLSLSAEMNHHPVGKDS